MTTGEAMRAFCQECVNSHLKKVIENCGGEHVIVTKKPCALLKYRLKGKGTLSAIRKNCVECQGGKSSMVSECETETCFLYPFRLDKHPNKIGGVGRAANFKKKAGNSR